VEEYFPRLVWEGGGIHRYNSDGEGGENEARILIPYPKKAFAPPCVTVTNIPVYPPRGCSDSPGGYSGFQVTGMIEGFFGFEIFDSEIFWAGKLGRYFFR